MSIIGKLFSLKEKPAEQNPEIPPNIEKLVKNKSAKKKEWVKYVIMLLISVGFALVGYVGVQRLYTPSRSKLNENADKIIQVHRATIPQLSTTTTTVPPKEVPSSSVSTVPSATLPSKQAEVAVSTSTAPSSQVSTTTLTQQQSPTTTLIPKAEPKVSLAKKSPGASAASQDVALSRPPKVATKKEKPVKEKDTAQKEELELVSKNESERDMYIYQAKAYESRGDILNAIEYYKKAVGLDPKNFKLQNQLAALCIKIKDGKCAVEHAQIAAQLNPEYVPGIVNLAIGLALLGKDVEAEEKLLIALGKSPNNVFAWKNLALIYEKRGDLTNAEAIYQKLISFGEPEGYLGLARVLERMNRYDEAANIYNLVCKDFHIDDGLKAYAIQRLNVISPLLKK